MKHPLTIIALSALLLSGCGGTGDTKERFPISGQVTFNGKPVAAGNISFSDPASGEGGFAEVDEGSFTVSLAAGNYKIAVSPPMIETPGTANTPGSEEYQKVADIPEKYHQAETSGLTLEVKAANNAALIELK